MKIFVTLISLCILAISTSLICCADIMVEPVSSVGDDLVIGGNTNFNTDNSVLVEVWPSSFGPRKKFESTMSGGGSAVVPVTSQGDSVYSWTVTFKTSDWSPDRYMIRAEIIGKDFSDTTMFDLVWPEDEISIEKEPIVEEPVVIIEDRVEERHQKEVLEVEMQQIPITPDPSETKQAPLFFSIFGLLAVFCIIGLIIQQNRR